MSNLAKTYYFLYNPETSASLIYQLRGDSAFFYSTKKDAKAAVQQWFDDGNGCNVRLIKITLTADKLFTCPIFKEEDINWEDGDE